MSNFLIQLFNGGLHCLWDVHFNNFQDLWDQVIIQFSRLFLQELADIKASGLKSFRDIDVDDRNILIWSGLIVPENPPYNKGAFRIEITFPAEYPFKVSFNCFSKEFQNILETLR